MESPNDYVCDECGSDDVGGITYAREIINGEDSGKLEPWSDHYDYYNCGNCSSYTGEVGVIQRREYADEHKYDGPWAVVNEHRDYHDGGWVTHYTVKVYHPNGERVGVWVGDSRETLKRTEGPETLTLDMVCNLGLAFSLAMS